MKSRVEAEPLSFNRPMTVDEDRDFQLRLGRPLSYQERFEWLCRTVEVMRPLLGRARQASRGEPPVAGQELTE